MKDYRANIWRWNVLEQMLSEKNVLTNVLRTNVVWTNVVWTNIVWTNIVRTNASKANDVRTNVNFFTQNALTTNFVMTNIGRPNAVMTKVATPPMRLSIFRSILRIICWARSPPMMSQKHFFSKFQIFYCNFLLYTRINNMGYNRARYASYKKYSNIRIDISITWAFFNFGIYPNYFCFEFQIWNEIFEITKMTHINYFSVFFYKIECFIKEFYIIFGRDCLKNAQKFK